MHYLLAVPPVCTTFASHGFSVAALSVWNSLPSGTCCCLLSHRFCRLLKTHCLEQAFSSPFRAYCIIQVPRIQPLTDTAHYKGFSSFTFLLISTETSRQQKWLEMNAEYGSHWPDANGRIPNYQFSYDTTTWNSLPKQLCNPVHTISIFGRLLKTFLFSEY